MYQQQASPVFQSQSLDDDIYYAIQDFCHRVSRLAHIKPNISQQANYVVHLANGIVDQFTQGRGVVPNTSLYPNDRLGADSHVPVYGSQSPPGQQTNENTDIVPPPVLPPTRNHVQVLSGSLSQGGEANLDSPIDTL